MLGALVSAGASLISGLFGKSDAEKRAKREEAALARANAEAKAATEKMNREVRARADAAALVPVQTSREGYVLNRVDTSGGVDMPAFMKAAEENGFNPLTFLRSGALSLFAKSSQTASTYTDEFNCTTGERAMDAALSGTALPSMSPVIAQTQVPGMGEVFGNALTTGINTYYADQAQARQEQLQRDVMNAQLQGTQRNPSYIARSFYVPSSRTAGPSTQTTKVPNLYVEYIDNSAAGGGKHVWLPNSEIADSEQLTAALLASAGYGAAEKMAPPPEPWINWGQVGKVLWPDSWAKPAGARPLPHPGQNPLGPGGGVGW